MLELTPSASRLLHNWTPRDQVDLSTTDTDLGSTSPALLPDTRLAVQGGKDGQLRLLNLARLNGTTGGAGRGSAVSSRTSPPRVAAQLLTAPAVWRHGGRDYLFVADDSGTAKYVLSTGSRSRLRGLPRTPAPGPARSWPEACSTSTTSWEARLNVYDPASLHRLASLPAATGHWNSPIVDRRPGDPPRGQRQRSRHPRHA